MGSDAETVPAVVTGGAGAIGSVLVERLAAAGHPVTVVDNLSSGRRDFLASVAGRPGFRLVVEDLRTFDAIAPAFRGARVVWHLAANPDIRLGTEDPRVDFEHGTLATFHVLDAARRADCAEFGFASSSVVYGLPTVFPTPEEYGPLLPQSLYGASKLASEAMISAFCHAYGIRGWIFRFANIIGPRMTHGVIHDFFEKVARTPSRLEVLGDGRQAKSYLRVEECVDGLLTVADHAKDPVTVVNLGTRDRVSVREIAERVAAAHRPPPRIDYTGGERGWVGDIPQQLLAIERAGTLGWSPKWTSVEAVDRTVAELAAARHR